MGAEANSVLPPVKGIKEHFIALDERLRAMDAMRIDTEILSINPFWYAADRDLATRVTTLQNEKLTNAARQKLRDLRRAALIDIRI